MENRHSLGPREGMEGGGRIGTQFQAERRLAGCGERGRLGPTGQLSGFSWVVNTKAVSGPTNLRVGQGKASCLFTSMPPACAAQSLRAMTRNEVTEERS